MKSNVCALLLLNSAVLAASANTPPTVQVLSTAMRPGTTWMDVTYRITDPDDATVKVRALAFVDGVRSFANVIRPATWMEGTQANIGDAIATGVDHTLTWDVRADWDIDLAQVKFEVLCRDGRGLLDLDWITIPAAGGHPALTISKNAPTDPNILDALFWQYAAGDPALTLANGLLHGNANSGLYAGVPLGIGSTVQTYALPYLAKMLNVDPASDIEVKYAANAARAGIADTARWHLANRPYDGLDIIVAWGKSSVGQTIVPAGLTDVAAIAAGEGFSLALKSDGTVVAWGVGANGSINVPAGLTEVTAISAGQDHALALKSNGSVIAWGSNQFGQSSVPFGLSGVTAISAPIVQSLALINNGTVVGWGNIYAVPIGLTDVIAISGGDGPFILTLKSNGTVFAWGNNGGGAIDVPAGLTGVVAISGGRQFSLALKNDGTVVAWGANSLGQTNIPSGLTGVKAIDAGEDHSLALKIDGTVIAWGRNNFGQINVPPGITGVMAISTGENHNLALKKNTP